MKKCFVIFTLLFLIASSAYAQSVPASDFKVTLIDAIKDYFTSQTPKLTVDELKDLIVAYLTAPGDVVDLSKTGSFSKQKLETIYNKAKGKPCVPSCVGKCGGESNGCGGTCDNPCTGTYSAQVASAVKLDKPTVWDANMYGYFTGPPGGVGEYTIPKDAEVWFLVDPKGFGVISTPCLKMEFRDYQQGGNLYIQMYILDQNDNLVNPATLGFSMNPIVVPLDKNSANFNWLCNKHKDSQKYLIKITETRGDSTPYNIAWWFG